VEAYVYERGKGIGEGNKREKKKGEKREQRKEREKREKRMPPVVFISPPVAWAG